MKKLSKTQQKIVDLMTADSELKIRSNQYEHLQKLTNDKPFDLDRPFFSKVLHFHKSTLRCLIEKDMVSPLPPTNDYEKRYLVYQLNTITAKQ